MPKKNRLIRPVGGLSYADANSGRLITIQDDVLGFKKRIMETWPELNVYFDNEELEWVITQIDYNGTESLFFTTKTLNQDTMDRIHNAQGDPFASIEAAEAEADREHDRKVAELVGEAGERLAHAFAKDGLTTRPKISMNIPNRERTKRRASIYG